MNTYLWFIASIGLFILYKHYIRQVLRSDEFKKANNPYTYFVAGFGILIIYQFYNRKIFKLMFHSK